MSSMARGFAVGLCTVVTGRTSAGGIYALLRPVLLPSAAADSVARCCTHQNWL